MPPMKCNAPCWFLRTGTRLDGRGKDGNVSMNIPLINTDITAVGKDTRRGDCSTT